MTERFVTFDITEVEEFIDNEENSKKDEKWHGSTEFFHGKGKGE